MQHGTPWRQPASERFIGTSGGFAGYAQMMTLLAEATKKAGLVWIIPEGGARAQPVWHHWQDGAAYVLGEGGEQPLRGLADAQRATVTVPAKTTGGRIVTWVATVTRVAPGSEEWDKVIAELFTKRLNAPDGRQAPERWARESILLRLDPTGATLDLPDGSGAAPRPPSPATTSGPLPFVLGRRRDRH
jgi:hypothetical protein